VRTRICALALSTAILAGCTGSSRLKPTDGSPLPLYFSNSNEDSWPGRPGDIGWALQIEAKGSITPSKDRLDGVLDAIEITANPASKSAEIVTQYIVCLAFAPDYAEWDMGTCSTPVVVDEALEGGRSYAANNARFSIPTSAGRLPARHWFVIRVYSPTRDGREGYIYAHSQRGMLVGQDSEE
jgi:hypothetical protein